RPELVEYSGEGWVSAALQQVPTVVWPSRPHTMAERYIMWINPDVGRAGGGLAFSAAAEGYANLGLLGTFAQIALTSFAFFFGPMSACLRRKRSLVAQALAACIASFAYNQFRGEPASVIKVTIAFAGGALPILLVAGPLQALRDEGAGAPGPAAATASNGP